MCQSRHRTAIHGRGTECTSHWLPCLRFPGWPQDAYNKPQAHRLCPSMIWTQRCSRRQCQQLKIGLFQACTIVWLRTSHWGKRGEVCQYSCSSRRSCSWQKTSFPWTSTDKPSTPRRSIPRRWCAWARCRTRCESAIFWIFIRSLIMLYCYNNNIIREWDCELR